MTEDIGGVGVIGTLVPMNNGKFPVVRSCDVGLSNGDNLEHFIRNNFDDATMSGSGDIVTDYEVSETPFSEVNEKNTIRIRLKKNGKQVFCSIYSSLELPENGILPFDTFMIPKDFRPIHTVYMPYISIKNERERGVGQFVISSTGHVNIFASSDEDGERCSSTTWITR